MTRWQWVGVIALALFWQGTLFASLTPGTQAAPVTVTAGRPAPSYTSTYGAVPTSAPTTEPTRPDPAGTVRPYVASPEPPRTVTGRRGGTRVDPDPVRLYFRSCADVPDELRPLHRGDPGYRSELDRDRDGSACEL